MEKPFCVGDLVFAKMRGYPPWPAKIEGLAPKSPNHVKYIVLFFGTSERAACLESNLFHYEEYKTTYGKPLKRKGFKDALKEIEKAQACIKKANPEQNLIETKNIKDDTDKQFETPVPNILLPICKSEIPETDERGQQVFDKIFQENSFHMLEDCFAAINCVPGLNSIEQSEAEKRRKAELAGSKEVEEKLLAHWLQSQNQELLCEYSDDGDDESVESSADTREGIESKRKTKNNDTEAVKRKKVEKQLMERAQEKAGQEWEQMIMSQLKHPRVTSISSTTLQDPAASDPLHGNSSTSSPSAVRSMSHASQEPTENTFQSSAPAPETFSEMCPSHQCKTCGKCWSRAEARLSAVEAKLDGLSSLKSKVGKILELLHNGHENNTNSPPTYCYGKEVVNGKVTLAQNITCSDISWKRMNQCTDTPDWCLSLLRGTFGERNAMFYRIYPRYKDCKPFSATFLCAAKAYYKDFLDRRIKELTEQILQQPQNEQAVLQKSFFSNNYKKLVAQIGATLSQRADTMLRQWRKYLIASGMPVPARVKLREKMTHYKPKGTCGQKFLTTSKSVQPRIDQSSHRESDQLVGPCATTQSAQPDYSEDRNG